MLEPDIAEWTPGRRTASRAAEKIGWYWNRLRCMTPAELAHRALRSVQVHAESLRREGAEAPLARSIGPLRPWIRVPPNPDAAGCIAAAARIVAGRFDLFALKDAALGNPPRWNIDPRTGIEAPLRFGKRLDYRDAARVGDIKYLWELNRHLHLVTLAQAGAITGDLRYGAVLRAHLESWFAACPYRSGANWSSALEPALRLISWSAAWQLLGGEASPLLAQANAGFRERWLQSVFHHASFVRGHFSLYSSANNHLIGEAAGLYVAALTWPCWPHAARWREAAKRILEREVELQNGADGVNREQAVAYQRSELELLLICRLAGEAHGETFSSAFHGRIEAMLEYLASIMDAGGNVPMIGDSDDAIALRLDHRAGFCGYRSLLATGAILFRRGDFAKKAGALDERTRWLIADADAAFRALDTRAVRLPVKQAFPAGGYYILGCDFETPQEIRLIVDAGAIGYQTIAAHGHADALAFCLSAGGMEFLIDPGTYAYHTRQAWRRYFRGTGAHNTVRIDGADQSQAGGSFMWLRKARAVCASWSSETDRDAFEGWHDGYCRLNDPVLHRRRIVLDKRARWITLEDRLEMKGSHVVELFFHCSERCGVHETADGFALSQGTASVQLKLPRATGAAQRIYCGSLAPIAGWVSRRFDERQPAPTIVWRCRIAGDASLRTEIRC